LGWLAHVADSRDPETGEHLRRMRRYAQMIAEELADHGPYAKTIDGRFLEDLYRSSPLHDIGKVAVPDSILQKPGRWTLGFHLAHLRYS
jgi:putative two-component system response regulator